MTDRPQSGASIEFSGVRKRYGSTVALDELDLHIKPGEFVSLLGPSGSGKSTTLNILAGLLQPDEGKVLIGGRDVTRLSPDKRDIAMVFQNYALYPHMTVAENLAFPLQAPGRSMERNAIVARVNEVAKALGIEQLLQRQPREISGGQQQRVALGRAMVRDPKVFLLDEPLSNLDARLRLRMRRDLKALHQRLRSTIVYVTHDQSEAMSLSDRVAIYMGGKLQQFAPPLEIYRHPVNLFVAQFMGEREMNTLIGRVESTDTGCVMVSGSLRLPLEDAATWRHFQGRDVILGIRAEGIQIAGHGEVQGTLAKVRLVEHAGAEQVFFADAENIEFCGRVPADSDLRTGDDVRLHLVAHEMFLFDASNGLALVQGGQPARSVE